MADHDVLIAGGGPGGCATAISLRDFAPELGVAVVDSGSPQRSRLGETLPPQAAVFLKHLWLAEPFARDGHTRAHRTLSAWGTAQPVANEFLYGVHQSGWRLDRARFDAALVETTQARGVCWNGAHVHGAEYRNGVWHVHFADDTPRTARFLVDATGRNAHLCRQFGIVPQRLDRLIACVVRFPAAAESIDMTLETFADGWWYATTLPNRERVLACLSDSDILRRRRFADTAGWLRGLEETRFMREIVADDAPQGPPQLFAASSIGRTLPGGSPFLAVGDAASAFDPLASQGITKALRAGIFASYAIADLLLRNDARGIARYRHFVADEFDAYRHTLRDYYRREQRWADRPFWVRRHALGDRFDSRQPETQSALA